MGIIRNRRSTQARSLTEPGFGVQQQLFPNMRPDGVPLPNLLVPIVQPGQQGQHPGGSVGADPVQQGQQQMLPRGRAYCYPPGPNVAGGRLSTSYNAGGMPLRGGGSPPRMPIGQLVTALAHSSPETQRMILGESVYPLVKQLEPEKAAKITGMLLELDPVEVLHLLDSPEAMRARVAEAMEVLRNAFPEQFSDPADQLPSLSRNEGV